MKYRRNALCINVLILQVGFICMFWSGLYIVQGAEIIRDAWNRKKQSKPQVLHERKTGSSVRDIINAFEKSALLHSERSNKFSASTQAKKLYKSHIKIGQELDGVDNKKDNIELSKQLDVRSDEQLSFQQNKNIKPLTFAEQQALLANKRQDAILAKNVYLEEYKGVNSIYTKRDNATLIYLKELKAVQNIRNIIRQYYLLNLPCIPTGKFPEYDENMKKITKMSLEVARLEQERVYFSELHMKHRNLLSIKKEEIDSSRDQYIKYLDCLIDCQKKNEKAVDAEHKSLEAILAREILFYTVRQKELDYKVHLVDGLSSLTVVTEAHLKYQPYLKSLIAKISNINNMQKECLLKITKMKNMYLMYDKKATEYENLARHVYLQR
ncbi:hypothetical protein NEAUS04_2580 [Nematocida ausubeli]|uniref:Uncharacterized protein n=1 Tax=Nematocida ausubeli (strain ATCC PRA-371 / ERTm2) TaxID=1913371 RepID=A0A086J225_NEMA1|nr:uncharacterized protein NESG_01309 [Nematocida ausubeli]KAI5151540.1 hypothetical protein NEAUS05_2531 [Nematocida ausubeli]KAI5166585.1 hypothetical protein NEAUS04_2580 [Nematocida ausubeli]KFG26193.1 hypothetical protein NESG_01309 [Nematocida ausubeli]